ncbi:hypothetical protein CTEN210_13623 [Chaetoceros tenuissimus]|uniref:Potassium channel tetramerisation-type BTB domain-containing protein n=1 Tax=Chaetoceros tenuissimus TaxID=426638 RepID=A0AAD3D3C9_9STRA|nr:hypothetical protein CTEN210_13623 [Chaetoceros tenuissimus]
MDWSTSTSRRYTAIYNHKFRICAMSTFSTPPTVQLDVGGTLYKVSLPLIMKFQNSKLAKIVSKKRNENIAGPIFIERNGHRFQYVLDYMRDGEEGLQCMDNDNIDLSCVYKELRYFGILTTPPNTRDFRSMSGYLKKLDTNKNANMKKYFASAITEDIFKTIVKYRINIAHVQPYEHVSESWQMRDVFVYISNGSWELKNELILMVNRNLLRFNLEIFSFNHHPTSGSYHHPTSNTFRFCVKKVS